MCDVVQMIRDEGFADGERRSFANGTNGLYAILSALQAEGRNDELARILSDRNYMTQVIEGRL